MAEKVRLLRYKSIMSGDSPSAHITEGFDFIDGRSSPVPTTSKDVGIQSTGPMGSTGALTASVLVEQPKDKRDDKDDDAPSFPSPVANSSDDGKRRDSDADQTRKVGDSDRGDDHSDKKDCQKKSGGLDQVDFVPAKSERKMPDINRPNDDGCCIKCLSFTLECCECTIM